MGLAPPTERGDGSNVVPEISTGRLPPMQ